MKHDLSGRFWTDTLEMKGDRARGKRAAGVIVCLGKLRQFKAAASDHREIPRQTNSTEADKRDVLQVVWLAGSGICVDFESLLKLLNVSLLHRHLSLHQKYVLATKASVLACACSIYVYIAFGTR